MNLMKFTAMLFLGFASVATAKTETKPIEIKDGYVFLPMKGSNATAGYGTIKNTTSNNLKLSVESAEGFKAVELHETISEKGMMKMQKMESANLLKNASFDLKPGGNHIMLFDPLKDFREGDLVQVTFNVDNKKITIPFIIKKRTEAPHAHH